MHLVPYHVRRASARAAHVVALVCLSVAAFVILSLQSDRPDHTYWPALIPIGILGLMLWLIDANRTAFVSATYLVVGSVCVYWVCYVAMTELPGRQISDTFVLSLVKVALVMVGGSGVGLLSAIGWSAAGYIVAGSATFVATAVTNSIFVLDGTPLAAFLLFVLVQAGLALSRRWSSTAQPSLHRAARDEQISDMRFKIEVKAAAIMHDTVLNHLAAIANAPDGPLRPEMRLQVDRDLEVLVGEEWLLDAENGPDAEAGSEWRQSKLFKVVDEVRQLGLHIDVSGDVVAVGRLGVDRATAVALATKQCLVNVLNHSGTDRAELVVYGSDREVSVMVIDTGVGFMEDETGADRLGLRHSVRRRIETVGGTVQVWSTPGKGTSVMIRVPALAPEIDVFVPTELEPT